MKNYSGITLLLLVLFFVACKSDNKSEPVIANIQETQKPQETLNNPDIYDPNKSISKLPKKMPDQYKDLAIPLFTDANIERVTKHKHADGDKIQLAFTTTVAPKDIEEYYLDAMKKNGWTVTNSTKKPRKFDAYFSIYNNGKKQLLINSVPHPKVGKTTTTMNLMDFNLR